ncbi:MAG: LamG-like jellyroll fold domain-containing protein [Kiritimatiellia bacterium]|nr:LamG-like jellyroll fold domain-containing protein [Kiritimatiellia bacterium]
MRNMSNNIKRFSVAVLAACGLAVSAALAEPSYQAKLTVQGYDGAELADFPVLVRLSSQTIVGFDGTSCEVDGSDLRFVNDTGDVYPHEIDTWDREGESLVWVKLPQLAKGKSFIVQWGGGPVASSNASGTWNANYAGVWHMGEESGVCANSTAYGPAYDATPKGETSESVRYDGSDAPVGGARTTAKTTNTKTYLKVPDSGACDPAGVFKDGVFTISGWVRCESKSGFFRLFSRKDQYEGSGWEIESRNDEDLRVFLVRGHANNPNFTFTLPSPGLLKNWMHLAFVYDREDVYVYANGDLIKKDDIAPATDNGLAFSIGCNSNGSDAFAKGAFDECRLMDGAASADWVKAEHATAANRGFLAYDMAEILASADPTLTLTAFRSSSVTDASADFMAYVSGLGKGAASATLTLEYGFDAASLDRTQEVKTIDQAGGEEFCLSRLQPGRTYFVRLVVRNNLDQSIESDVLRVKTVVSPDAFSEPGLNQTFFPQANAKWDKSYAELPQGTDWRNYEDGERIYRREFGVLAAYLGNNPGKTKRTSAVWGDEVYWPMNGGQWVYWGKMRLEGGKSYLFRTCIDDNERIQITDPSTGETTTLLEEVSSWSTIITSSPFEPKETGWYPIEIRLSDGTGYAGGCKSTDDYLNTENMGWSDDGGTTWNLMMDPGDGSLFVVDGRASVSVKEVISDGARQGLALTFPAASGPRDLYVAWGPEHGGDTLEGWANRTCVATIEAGQTDATAPLPLNWGTDDSLVLRCYLLDGVRPVWSPSVYWRDVADPEVSLDALNGRDGDKLTVTGDLKDCAGGPCTLTVLVGPSEDEMTNAWTTLDGSVRPSSGAFELTLFEPNASSSKYLAPGKTYYVCIEAEAGGRRTRSQTKRVTMAGAPAFGSVSAGVERRTVTFRGRLTDAGMGDVATVSLWVGESDDADTFKQSGEELDKQGGEFSFEHTFPDFERTYYWQFRAVSTSAGGTAVVTTRTDVASCTTADTATYTWKGGADDKWETRANWENSGGDVLGYPNGTQTTVNFPADTKARIVLSAATSVGTLNLKKEGIEVTLARADGLGAEDAKPKLSVKSALTLTGARLRLVLDGVALESPDTSLSVSDGEVQLSNGARWDVGTLDNDKGGRLLLGPGTFLSCANYRFGGGLTEIDNATLEVRGSAVLGKSVTGGKIRFVGTHPAFRCSAKTAQVRSDLEGANVRLEFAVPVGGYETPPFVNDNADPDCIMGYNGSTKRLWPITVDVARDSPAALDRQKMTTTLISWGKGICPEIIQPAAKPGANATFVWSEEKEGENPVSLGVSLIPTGFIILVR